MSIRPGDACPSCGCPVEQVDANAKLLDGGSTFGPVFSGIEWFDLHPCRHLIDRDGGPVSRADLNRYRFV